MARVSLTWNNAIDESGIKLYNIYINDIMSNQCDCTLYYTEDLEDNTTYSFFVVAETNEGKYLKSNKVELTTLVTSGEDNNFNYTFDFIL